MGVGLGLPSLTVDSPKGIPVPLRVGQWVAVASETNHSNTMMTTTLTEDVLEIVGHLDSRHGLEVWSHGSHTGEQNLVDMCLSLKLRDQYPCH